MDRSEYCWECGQGYHRTAVGPECSKTPADERIAELEGQIAYIRRVKEIQLASLPQDGSRGQRNAWDTMAMQIADAETKTETLRVDVAKVLEGFDNDMFVRNTNDDADSGWAVKIVPYIAALGRLAAFVQQGEANSS
jgi:hypothetical protein